MFASLLQTLQATAALLGLSLVLFTYERGLVPIYGSVPTSFWLGRTVFAIFAVSTLNPIKISVTQNLLWVALVLSLAPNAAYWVPVISARWGEPFWGPAITHIVVLSPMIFPIANLILDTKTKKSALLIRFPITFRLLSMIVCYAITTILSQTIWHKISYLNVVSDSQIYLTFAGVTFSMWIATYPVTEVHKSQRKVASSSVISQKVIFSTAFLSIWWSIYPKLASPVLPHPSEETYTHPSFPLQIHSSVQSTTGLIVVGEALPPLSHTGVDDQEIHSVRYLRASHSILGGVWMGSKVMTLDGESPVLDSHGTPLGDSIYSAFVLQEAARFVNSTAKGKAGKWENVLVIGLGSGISATAFSRHGMSTTIVEIDPAVYAAARRFFGLPNPGAGHVFLEDARSWVAQKRASHEKGNDEILFDIVVHDCFSGGGVPQHIFTVEFWEDLKSVMQPEGILVVNFAGKVKSDASRMIIQTLEKEFGQCRGFHDLMGDMTQEQYDSDFINMVLFCTQSTSPLTFRPARSSDFLGSPLRRHIFESLPSREVNLDILRVGGDDHKSFILTDAYNPLGKLQEAEGHHHWKLMRQVLKDIYWETY